MILTKFTPEETQQLIDDVTYLFDNIRSLGKQSVLIVEQKYAEYVEQFRPKLFFWAKPLSLKDIVTTMNPFSAGASIREYDDVQGMNMQYELVGNGYATFRSYTWSDHISVHKFAKQNVLFTEKELAILRKASFLWYTNLHNAPDGFGTKLRIVFQYAEKPFQIEEDDIWFIERIRNTVKDLREFNAKWDL